MNLKAQFVVAYALETPINPSDLQAHYVIGVTLSAVASFLDKFSYFSHVQVYKLFNQPLTMNSYHLERVKGGSRKNIIWDL
jgi:hypothetical protein